MNVLFIGLAILGGVTFLALIIFTIHQQEKARTAAFQATSNELGLQFHHKGDPQVQADIGHLRLFNQGHSRTVRNMISGQTEDVELAVFGYSYNTGGGQNQQVHRQSVISFCSPHLSLPEFELRPEGVFHKIGQAFGYQDIDFDSHPNFSKQYLLRGPDEAAIRQLFTPELLTFFESLAGVSVEALGDRLIYYRAGKRIKPEEVRSFMEEGFQVYGKFKQQPDS